MIKGFAKLTGIVLPSLVFMISMAVVGFAQSNPIEGAYNVTAQSTEIGTINFLLILKRTGDKWTGEVKDSPIPLEIKSINVDESNITILMDAGGTTVTNIGKIDGGKIAGNFTAGDIKGTWAAIKNDAAVIPSDKAVASASARSASAASAAGIEGTYEAKIVADGQPEIPFTFVVKRDGEKLVTEAPNGGDLIITGIETRDPDVVTLTATYQGAGPVPLSGKRNGDEIEGKWQLGNYSGTWSAKKKK